MSAIITLKQYLGKNKQFVIPNYQRGYVWGKERPGEKNSVEFLLDDLKIRFQNNLEVFLQGVTVTEKAKEIILIDGQQRTTCLYLLLKFLKYTGSFVIKYDIGREESKRFLENINFTDNVERKNEDFQDIYFFKKTLRIIEEKLKDIQHDTFLDFLLHKVKFLYINVEEGQATKVFTMMNGSKAQMLQEEIIKAEILRLASINNDNANDSLLEWENNLLRSRYAREWDKWLRWWNTPKVQSLFRCKNKMGLLVSSYLGCNNREILTFEKFKNKYLKGNEPTEAKQTFNELRRLQKRFEDVYNNPIQYNQIGAIFRLLKPDNVWKFIKYFFVEDNRKDLEEYYNLTFLGMTHDEIVDVIEKKTTERVTDKYSQMLDILSEDRLYEVDKESAFRFLLRLNIDEDNKQNNKEGRQFDFTIWDYGIRSLEHVYPKSKVGHKGDDGKWYGGDNLEHEENYFTCKREDIRAENSSTTEHSIGNLVLLYRRDNSALSNDDFAEKKEFFFNTNKKEYFYSRHLLHTIYVFANTQWTATKIAKNKEELIVKFKNMYKKYDKKQN